MTLPAKGRAPEASSTDRRRSTTGIDAAPAEARPCSGVETFGAVGAVGRPHPVKAETSRGRIQRLWRRRRRVQAVGMWSWQPSSACDSRRITEHVPDHVSSLLGKRRRGCPPPASRLLDLPLSRCPTPGFTVSPDRPSLGPVPQHLVAVALAATARATHGLSTSRTQEAFVEP
jgi:hypothetical protein